MKNIAFLFVLISYLANAQSSDRLIYEKDIVKSTERIRLKVSYVHRNVIEKNTSFLSMRQLFFKETDQHNITQFNVYEYLRFSFSTLGLSKEMYLIIDNNDFVTIHPNFILADIKPESDASKSEILKSDSTKAEVITGYSNYNIKTFKLTYQLTEEQCNKIVNSKHIKFRYYSGFEMITVKLDGMHLQRLKKLIQTT